MREENAKEDEAAQDPEEREEAPLLQPAEMWNQPPENLNVDVARVPEKIVKRGNIVVLIDSSAARLARTKELLVSFHYEGHIESKDTTVEAIEFLNNVVDEAGQVVPVDLVFCHYNKYKDKALKIME